MPTQTGIMASRCERTTAPRKSQWSGKIQTYLSIRRANTILKTARLPEQGFPKIPQINLNFNLGYSNASRDKGAYFTKQSWVFFFLWKPIEFTHLLS